MEILRNNWDKKALITAVCLFFSIPPYMVWNTTITPIVGCIAGVLAFTQLKGGNKYGRFGALLLFSLYFYYSFVSGCNIWGWLSIILITPFFLANDSFNGRVYCYFYKIYVYTMIVSFIVYLLVIFGDVGLPCQNILPLNLEKLDKYYAYPFLITIDTDTIRFFGLYDEPGVIGTISGMILVVERFNLKKWENIALMLMTIFTFSMFFYIICAVYILIYGKMKYKIIVALVVLSVTLYFWENEIMYELVFKRFMLNSDGKLVGNTREHGGFSDWYEQFSKTSAYYTGLGHGMGAKMNDGGSSYKQLIVDYGVIYFSLLVLAYYMRGIRYIRKRNNLILFSLLFLSTMYQRPFISNVAYVFLFTVSPYLLNEIEEHKKNYNDDKSFTYSSVTKRGWR